MSGEFVNTQIDGENDSFENYQDHEGSEEEIAENRKLKNSLGGKDIVHLNINHIPRDLIPLEKLFDQNGVVRDPKMKLVDDAFEDKIIGTQENPRIIKLSKNLHVKEKEDYVNLMKRYNDVFY